MDRRILENLGASLVIRALSLLVSLCTMPVYLAFFREEAALGCWFTIWSMLSWLLNLDFGLGNSLRNQLAGALAREDRHQAGACVTGAYGAMVGICLVTGAVFFCVFPRILWNDLPGLKGIPLSAVKTAVGIGFLGMLGQLLLRPVTGILYAMQLSAVNGLLGLCSSVLGILGILLLPSGEDGQNLAAMAAVQSLAGVLPLLAATLAVFSGRTMRHLRPGRYPCGPRTRKQLRTLGGGFFLVQTAYMLIMNTNEFLITALRGAACVVEYQISSRLFFLGSSLFSLAMMPVWSAVTRAAALGEYAWTKRLCRRLLFASAGAAGGLFLLVPLMQPLTDLWLGTQSIALQEGSGIWMAALGAMLIWNSAVSSIANGLGRLRVQMICFPAGAAAKYPLSVLLTGALGSWTGVAAANVLVLLPYCLAETVALIFYFRKQEMLYE